MSKSRLLILIALLMTAFLGFMVIDHEHRRRSGTEIILDMEPVDPRSLFRGHYVRVLTPLRRLDTTSLAGKNDFTKGQQIYVTLQSGENGSWSPVSLLTSAPKGKTVFIQGRVLRPGKRISVRYNIESYFADKKTAKRLEKQVREHKMRLIVSLGKDGRAVIKGIEIDGVRQLDTL